MFSSYGNQSIDLLSKSTDWILYVENIGRWQVTFEDNCVLAFTQ